MLSRTTAPGGPVGEGQGVGRPPNPTGKHSSSRVLIFGRCNPPRGTAHPRDQRPTRPDLPLSLSLCSGTPGLAGVAWGQALRNVVFSTPVSVQVVNQRCRRLQKAFVFPGTLLAPSYPSTTNASPTGWGRPRLILGQDPSQFGGPGTCGAEGAPWCLQGLATSIPLPSQPCSARGGTELAPTPAACQAWGRRGGVLGGTE